MAAAYLAADALGIELQKLSSGRFCGAESKMFKLGPWTLDVWMEVQSDCATKSEVGLWVSLTERLWLYAWVTTQRTILVVFDAVYAGIDMGTRDSFSGGSPRNTLWNIKDSIRASFEWDSGQEVWKAATLRLDKL